MREFEFRGWGQEELAYALGYPDMYLNEDGYPNYEGNSILESNIVEWLKEQFWEQMYNGPTQEFINVVKNYIAALAKAEGGHESKHWGHVWATINEVEDDFTFLQILSDLIGHAWS